MEIDADSGLDNTPFACEFEKYTNKISAPLFLTTLISTNTFTPLPPTPHQQIFAFLMCCHLGKIFVNKFTVGENDE